MSKNEKPVLDIQVVQANGDIGKLTFMITVCSKDTEIQQKDRTTQTNYHYIAAKRPFEIAVLRTAIPSSEWNTHNVIAPKIVADDQHKPWVWLQKIKEHYVGASTLMQDRYHFWVKMTQPPTAPIAMWETMVCVAADRCSFGAQSDEFMSDYRLALLNIYATPHHMVIRFRQRNVRWGDAPVLVYHYAENAFYQIDVIAGL
ncbi:Hypothetical predicted protein [Paramuricea clavata]|uniref:Uncharacterized protein n=1 Tax=Paramuricea clavata TaxID=317549 RepID=A0A7D9I9G1_PARCT|nr:Hypothetical predicted protein [Paramuricea clavata]